MSYSYETEKPSLFTDDGQRMFIKMRDNAFRLCALAGCVRMREMMATVTGSSWQMLACADRMVELGDLIEVPQERCAGQHRIFHRPYQ
jgi:hypothetical protein